MKKYVIQLTIREGCDEFWKSLEDKTGCDEILEAIKMEVFDWTEDVKLVEYSDN